MKVLILNAGSSSHKCRLYDLTTETLPPDPPQPLWQGQLDWTHQQNQVELTVKTAAGATHEAVLSVSSRLQGLSRLLETLWSGDTQVIEEPAAIAVVGHRVVHGGENYAESVRIDDTVQQTIESLIPLAPEHNPRNLEGIQAISEILGDVPQVAAFDTAFHTQMPEAAFTYPVPYDWRSQGIRRYGFHGISHQYCAGRAAQLLDQPLQNLRLITCHLGNGCSLAAVQNGHSLDTTMGYTPLEGLMMGSRSGSVDPGLVLQLVQQDTYDAKQLSHLLNKASGLKGIFGPSGDMRQINQAIAQGDHRAALALDMFIHSLRRHIGSMLGVLGGLDALVFTAGIGENSPNIWQAIAEAFGFLGLKLDEAKLTRSPVDQCISTPDSAVQVWVIHTQEEWAIARDCWRLLQNQ
ncbi:MAG: acetate/propionate family kinase [Almyronema sp.]